MLLATRSGRVDRTRPAGCGVPRASALAARVVRDVAQADDQDEVAEAHDRLERTLQHDDVGQEPELVVGLLRMMFDGRLRPRLVAPLGRDLHRHSLVQRDHERVARDPDEHDAHPAQHEIAGGERQDEDVRGDEEPEAQIVPVLSRDRHVFEQDLDREAREQHRSEAPTHVEEPGIRASRDERDQGRHDDDDRVHQHGMNGTRIRSRIDAS